MKTYLVGGAVRDQLLKLAIEEKDWVVVGATVDEMLAQGYQSVGKDFPVFLHPQTKEEYALARTERKTGPGYKGFQFHTSPHVTLEEDLRRRDLTINAIAQDDKGNIIDPFGGCNDLASGILRHISPAFAEDPVRVLRLARFAARFVYLGFTIAPETMHLVRQMAADGELAHLVSERVWQECQRALTERHPRIFFDTLVNCDALKIIFPQLSTIYTEDNMQTLQHAAELSTEPRVRLASWLQFLPYDVVCAFNENFRLPNEYGDLNMLAAKYRHDFQYIKQASATELLYLLHNTDALRRPQRFADLVTAWRANILLSQSDELAEFLLRVQQTAMAVDVASIVKESNLRGEHLKATIDAARIKAIDAYLKSKATS